MLGYANTGKKFLDIFLYLVLVFFVLKSPLGKRDNVLNSLSHGAMLEF